MISDDQYLYYILKKPYDNKIKKDRELPAIWKVGIDHRGFFIKLSDNQEGEGPFDSLYDLKRKSIIFRSIKKQKHRDRISKNSNIELVKELMLNKVGTTFDKAFVDSFTHITIGKISRKKLSGIHFYDPDKIRIIERIQKDEETGVWSARIKKKNDNTGEWIEKLEQSTFFPEHWSISKVFMECHFAYKNKRKESDSVFISKTSDGIKVKFIIDEGNNVLTFFPLLE